MTGNDSPARAIAEQLREAATVLDEAFHREAVGRVMLEAADRLELLERKVVARELHITQLIDEKLQLKASAAAEARGRAQAEQERDRSASLHVSALQEVLNLNARIVAPEAERTTAEQAGRQAGLEEAAVLSASPHDAGCPDDVCCLCRVHRRIQRMLRARAAEGGKENV